MQNKNLPTLKLLLATLKTDSVRDLAWALFSPELISHDDKTFSVEATDERIQWLKHLDAECLSLPPHSRLGHYYESLWVYFFQHDKQYAYIAHNVQIHHQGKTLGEIDFIIFDCLTQRYIHLEVAIKFYMYYNDKNLHREDKALWIGPNSQDNLQKKWLHLNNEQTALTQLDACKTHLITLGINEAVLSAFSLKGYIFQKPYTNQKPQDLNTDNAIHPYYSHHEFLALSLNANNLTIIPKKSWLTQYHQQETIVLCSKRDITNMINAYNTPIMVATVMRYGTLMHEIERFFVMPDNWPHHFQNALVHS